jgi:hypothetical protein
MWNFKNSQMNNTGGNPESDPLQLFQPMTIIVFLSFFSPIILATSITSMSFLFQNFKGLIYLGFLLGILIVRNWVYMFAGSQPVINDRKICTSIQYSKYGNPTFSAFVFAFTITYLCFPMFSNGNVNWWIFTLMISYFFMDMFIKLYKKCIEKVSDLLLNILLGAASAAVFVTLMYYGGSGKYLFFNETSSNKDICYQPSEQTFKCKVFQNGEMVGEM